MNLTVLLEARYVPPRDASISNTPVVPGARETATDDPWLNAVLIEADDEGRATSIEQVLLPD